MSRPLLQLSEGDPVIDPLIDPLQNLVILLRIAHGIEAEAKGVETGTARDDTGVETGTEVETGTDRGETEVVTERGIVVARDRGETGPEAETEAAEGTSQEKGD